jgi:hypothetical protein
MNMDIRHIKSPKGEKLKFIVWHGGRKHVACLRTAKAVFANMIKGVTVGFQVSSVCARGGAGQTEQRDERTSGAAR